MLNGAGTVPFQASAGPRSYRQLDEEAAAAGAESHRVRTGLTGSEFMPGPNDSMGHETFMPSPSRVHPGQGLQSPGRSGSRATDYLPNSGPRASDYLPGRVPIPAATYPPAAGFAAGAGYVRGYDGFDAEWHLPAQPSKGDAPLDTEFTLLSREHPSTASRVERLPLTHGERDMVSYVLRRVQEVGSRRCSRHALPLRQRRLLWLFATLKAPAVAALERRLWPCCHPITCATLPSSCAQVQTESHVGLTRAHATRAIALLEQAGRQAGRQRAEQADSPDQRSGKKTRGARSVERRRRPGLVLRRHGSSYLGVSLARRPRLEPRRQRRKPSPRDGISVSAIYRMWDAGK